MLEAVIFDLGGVLILNGRPSDAASQFPGADPALVTSVIMGPPGEDGDHPWHRMERGEITMQEYQAATKERLVELGLRRERSGTTDRPPFAFLANPAMLELVVELRSAGIRTGMLTNNVREIRPHWWGVADWPSLFDDIVDSHEVGMRKPSPGIYQLALDRLGVAAGRTAFLDDLEPNVAAASALGMTGVHVTGHGEDAIVTVRRLSAP